MIHNFHIATKCTNLQNLSLRLNKTKKYFFFMDFSLRGSELRIESEWHGIDFANYLCSKYNMMGSWSNLPPSLSHAVQLVLPMKLNAFALSRRVSMPNFTLLYMAKYDLISHK